MADRKVSELIEATELLPQDLMLVEQQGTAKSISGQTMIIWLTQLADGHGGIASWDIQPGPGPLDFKIVLTLASGSQIQVPMENGRGITNITRTSRTGTADTGYLDTYTIYYSDDTTSTFQLQNGSKGDKGDNVYVHFKYAPKKPTSSSHSMGDQPDRWIGVYSGLEAVAPSSWTEYEWSKLMGDDSFVHIKWASEQPTGSTPIKDTPDKWIGIYTGPLASAPTSYTSYKWYQYKGEKGDIGTPARLVSCKTEYQAGESGTEKPSGAWTQEVPQVPRGGFLWTRTTMNFNTGSPVVSYSAAYMGIDGTGAVNKVCGLDPDPSGNVNITAANVGAATPEQVNNAIKDVASVIAKNLQILPSAWTTYTPSGEEETGLHGMGFTYRASVSVQGVDGTMIPYIVLDLAEVDASGINIVNQAQSYNGGVLIYADAASENEITLLSLECRKDVV